MLVGFPGRAVPGRERACTPPWKRCADRDLRAPRHGDPVARGDRGLLAVGGGARRTASGPAGSGGARGRARRGRRRGRRRSRARRARRPRAIASSIGIGSVCAYSERPWWSGIAANTAAQPASIAAIAASSAVIGFGTNCAVDDPDVLAVTGDDQAVGLQGVDVDQLGDRPGPPSGRRCRARRCMARSARAAVAGRRRAPTRRRTARAASPRAERNAGEQHAAA